MIGCDCVALGTNAAGDVTLMDCTRCKIHPLTCDGIHPVSGIGCDREPGHVGRHRYDVFWENTYA